MSYSKNIICEKCWAENSGKKITKGNLAFEILLYFFFIVPGIIYSLWRQFSKYTGCSKCGSRDIIPSDYGMGAMLKKQKLELEK